VGENEGTICLFQGDVPATCRQDANMQMIASAVVELKDGQKQIINLVEKSAEQRTEIRLLTVALTDEVRDRKHVNDIIFERIHDLEIAPSEVAKSRNSGLWGAVTSAVIAACIALLVALVKKQ
jgi:hypothetical protein